MDFEATPMIATKRIRFGIANAIATAGFLAAHLMLPAFAADIPPNVEDSGWKEVDAWVLQLVSTRPAPHPSGYWNIPVEEIMAVPYMTLPVSNALVRLKALGTSAFPALVRHLHDDRYSFSEVSAAWLNHTVGEAVLTVLSDGIHSFGGYKSRETPSGSAAYLSFGDYVKARDRERWAEWAKGKTRLDIQLDFIDWCVAAEEKRGFVDEDQRTKILSAYARARQEMRKKYSEAAKTNTENRSSSPATQR